MGVTPELAPNLVGVGTLEVSIILYVCPLRFGGGKLLLPLIERACFLSYPSLVAHPSFFLSFFFGEPSFPDLVVYPTAQVDIALPHSIVRDYNVIDYESSTSGQCETWLDWNRRFDGI